MTSADGIFRMFEGSISGHDSVVEHRPYHKNCKCALHDVSKKRRPSCSRHGSSENISFPIRRSWSEGNLLSINLSSSSSSSNLQSLSSSNSLANLASQADLTVDVSAAVAASVDLSKSHHHQLGWTIDEGEDQY